MKKKIIITIFFICIFLVQHYVVFINGNAHTILEKNITIINHTDVLPNDKDLKNLRYMNKLESCQILRTNITNIEFLNNMSNLKKLYIGTYSQIEDWTPLNNCLNLEYYCSWYISYENLYMFKNLEKLKELDLILSNTKSLNGVQYLTNLENLYVHGDELKDLSYLNNMSNLLYLRIENTAVDNNNILYLKNLKNLKLLDLSNNSNITNLSILLNFNKLEELRIHGTNIEDYSPIFELPNLKELTIDKGALTEDELTKLNEKGINVIEV